MFESSSNYLFLESRFILPIVRLKSGGSDDIFKTILYSSCFSVTIWVYNFYLIFHHRKINHAEHQKKEV